VSPRAINGMQIFWAAWNAGELGSIPLPGPPMRTLTPPPGPVPIVGSGKFDTPCARMQLDIASASARILALCAADGTPPFGMNLRHVCIADWNAGALTATPSTLSDAPDPARWLDWIAKPPLPLLPGSGKLGTPLARMHFANAIGEFVVAEAKEAEEAGDLPGAELPQAASSRLVASSAEMIVKRCMPT
jgi:hypothetical protein